MLQLVDLHIGYGAKTIQRNLNLRIDGGKLVCLLGTNGCGKSTLLRTLSGLQNPLSGNVMINNQNINTISQADRATLLSVVLTDKIDVDNATIQDIVALGRYPYTSFIGDLKDDDLEYVTNAIKQVGLEGREHEFFNALSDGEKQRVTIAKALAQATNLILLDEPTAHLDVPNRIKTMLLLKQLVDQQQKTIICSTHDLDIALQTADLVWLMLTNQGGVVEGIPQQLVEQGIVQQIFSDSTYSLVDNNGGLQIKINH